MKSIMSIAGLFTIFVVGTLAAVAGETDKTMDAIYVPVGRLVIAPPVGVTPKRSVVAFPHSSHFDYSCKTCHHRWDGNSQVQNCTASKCHDQSTPPSKNKKGLDHKLETMRYYKYAFHHQCIGCHREIKNQNETLERSMKRVEKSIQPTGPTGCADCHPRE